MYENIRLIKATFDDLTERNNIIVEYIDDEGYKIEGVNTIDAEHELLQTVLDKFSQTEIYEMTIKENESIHKFYKDMAEFIDYRNNGDIKIVEKEIETVTDNITLDMLKNLDVEKLFKLKLEMFEEPLIQESEDKESRSKIRKAKTLAEALHYFHKIVQNIDDKKSNISDPYDIAALNIISDEDLFKLKIQLFETEIVQNCEEVELRKKIRSGKTIFEILHAYQELINFNQNSLSEKSLQ